MSERYRQMRRVVPGVVALCVMILVGLALLGQVRQAAAGGQGERVGKETASVPAPTAPNCDPDWQIVNSPDPAVADNYLNGVDGTAADDVWAVGRYGSSGPDKTLIEHWDGDKWSIVASPNAGTGGNTLQGVTAVSASDAWAVGYYSEGLTTRTLTMHWNGSTWSITASPSPGASTNTLQGVSAAASNHVWAVGNYGDLGMANKTLAMEWNGSAWSVVASPNPGTNHHYVYGVSAVAMNDVWAVGYYYVGSVLQTLTMHWNGVLWNVVPSPNVAGGDSYLFGVDAVPGGGLWAVGYSHVGTADQTLTMKWDGSAWNIVQSPNGPDGNMLLDVVAMGPTFAWAVGHHFSATTFESLIMKWDGSAWSIVPSPSIGTATFLVGVAKAGSAPNEVWAVGRYSNGNLRLTVSLHWQGSEWRLEPSPNGDSVDSRLVGISAISSSDVWAAGYYDLGSNSQTVIEHWNGTNWRVTASANVASHSNRLRGIAAVSASDAWAVGEYQDATTSGTLVERWNGSAWSIVPSPNPSTGHNRLKGVGFVSANDGWAVGSFESGATAQVMTQHWDGSAWSVVPITATGLSDSGLNSVSGISASDVWAVGYYYDSGAGGMEHTLALHWDGTAWSQVSSPSPSADYNEFSSVVAIASNDVWAVGFYYDNNLAQTLVEHWDGTAWSVVASPSSGVGESELTGVTAVSGTNVWAVGTTNDGGVGRGMVLHWEGTAWNEIGSPTLGENGGTLNAVTAASAMDIWAAGIKQTSFAVSTVVERLNPCACTVGFSDVPAGSTFYAFVRCMACRGIINGYPDGTFKPNNDVTRGQLSKIVANAAGFEEFADGQQYEDVATDSTFFLFIWRLSTRGIVNGYPCGSLSTEPCVPPENRPYFRPSRNATRGQISKIVASAANLPMPPPQQTFEDVAVGSTFYEYIEALAHTGAINGYPCGGEGEPCVPPENRPYFRPSRNATRGQTSKIVANTFFPGCYAPRRE